MRHVSKLAIAANLALLVLFPIAWLAPLVRTGLLPELDLSRAWERLPVLFEGDAITVLSGIVILWEKDQFLAIAVVLFALVAPILKVAGVAAKQLGWLPGRYTPWLVMLGRLAMADIFLMALLIIIAKGVGIGRVDVAWGLYLFSFCVVMSLVLSLMPQTADKSNNHAASQAD